MSVTITRYLLSRHRNVGKYWKKDEVNFEKKQKKCNGVNVKCAGDCYCHNTLFSTEQFRNTYITTGQKSTNIILKRTCLKGRRQKELKNKSVLNKCSKPEPARDEAGILDTYKVLL